jgi:antitoxin ChpS
MNPRLSIFGGFMELSIQKWGNSAAVRLPTELLSRLNVTLGDKLSVNVQPDGVLLKAARPPYSLADLVAQCDLSAPEPADLAEWSNVRSVGREAW